MDDALQKFLTKDSSHTAAEAVEPKTAAISVATHLGYYRSNNEDNYYADELGISPVENSNKACELSLNVRRVFAVCDGMGGEDLGEEDLLTGKERCYIVFEEHLRPVERKRLEYYEDVVMGHMLCRIDSNSCSRGMVSIIDYDITTLILTLDSISAVSTAELV